MEHWRDQGIVLSARGHGENAAIVALLTASRGRHAGYVHGARSAKNAASCEVGTLVECEWSSRAEGQLGGFSLSTLKAYPAAVMDDAAKLAALQSACALCDMALPEREACPALFEGLCALLDILAAHDDPGVWGAAYVMWEIALLRELGFALDLTRCGGGGDAKQLAYISPRTGCAVSWQAGEPYKDKLLLLPDFLKPQGGGGDEADLVTGLNLTAYFLEHRVFIHSTGLPEARIRLAQRLAPHSLERRVM